MRKKNAKADKLSALTDKALDKYDEILDMDPSLDEGRDTHLIGVQAKVAGDVIGRQMQADSNALRQIQNDKLEELLAMLKGERELPSPERLLSNETEVQGRS